MKKLIPLILFLLIPNLAFALTVSGRKVVTTAGTRVQVTTTQTIYTWLGLCAETDNTGIISVGGSDVIASLSTRQGLPLEAGQCLPVGFGSGEGSDLSELYLDSTVSGDGVTYLWVIA